MASPHNDDVWTICTGCAPAPTLKDALKAIRAMEPGKWKWNNISGNCKTNAQLRCNAHVDCGFVMKAQQEMDGFRLYEKGQHGESPNLKRRKNSVFTFDEEEQARLALNMGGRPGKLHVALTLKELERLKEAGEDVEKAKEDEGGLAGVIACPPSQEYVSNTRIVNVLIKYLLCIVVCMSTIHELHMYRMLDLM